MNNIREFWNAWSKLTYAEAIEVATVIRDVHQGAGYDLDDIHEVAAMLNDSCENSADE